MALTKEEALRKAQMQAYASGASKGKKLEEIEIDPEYVRSLMGEKTRYDVTAKPAEPEEREPTRPAQRRRQATTTSTAQETPVRPTMEQVSPTAGQVDTSNAMRELYDAQHQRRIEALNAERQKILGALSGEEEKLEPMYREERTDVKTSTDIAGRKFADFLASRGLQASGLAGAGQISRQVAEQQQLGESRAREQAQRGEFAQARTQAEQAYASGLTQSELARQEAMLSGALSDLRTQSEREFALQREAINRNFQREMFALNAQMQEAQARGDFARQRELAMMQAQLQSERDARLQEFEREQAGVGMDFQREMALVDAQLREAQASGDLDRAKELADYKARIELNRMRNQASIYGSGTAAGDEATAGTELERFQGDLDALIRGGSISTTDSRGNEVTLRGREGARTLLAQNANDIVEAFGLPTYYRLNDYVS